MATHVNHFLDQYIESMRSEGVQFPILEVADETIDTEQLTRERLELLATDLFECGTKPIVAVSSSTTLSPKNQVVLTDASASNITITMPDPSEIPGASISFVRVDSSSNIANVSGGFRVIDTLSLVSDGSAWLPVSPTLRRGSASVSAASSVAVPISPSARSSDYVVNLMMKGDPLVRYWVSSRSTSSFTVSFSASTTVGFDWSIG